MCQAANCNKVRAENHNNRSKAVATSSSTDIFKMGATSLSRSTSPQLVTQLTEECKWACKYIVQFHEKTSPKKLFVRQDAHAFLYKK